MTAPSIACSILWVGGVLIHRALKYGPHYHCQATCSNASVNIDNKQTYTRYILPLKYQFSFIFKRLSRRKKESSVQIDDGFIMTDLHVSPIGCFTF
jgi:hypothetical protein